MTGTASRPGVALAMAETRAEARAAIAEFKSRRELARRHVNLGWQWQARRPSVFLVADDGLRPDDKLPCGTWGSPRRATKDELAPFS